MNDRGGIALVIVILSLAGCTGPSPVNSVDVASAAGDTPIRYVTCDAGRTNCLVSARFSDFDSCEHHKKWAGMLCDSRGTPGKMVCEEPHESVASAYCTK